MIHLKKDVCFYFMFFFFNYNLHAILFAFVYLLDHSGFSQYISLNLFIAFTYVHQYQLELSESVNKIGAKDKNKVEKTFVESSQNSYLIISALPGRL